MLVRTLVHIPEAHLRQLEQIAEDKQVARAVVVRWAITEYLKSFYLPAHSVDEIIIPNTEHLSPAGLAEYERTGILPTRNAI